MSRFVVEEGMWNDDEVARLHGENRRAPWEWLGGKHSFVNYEYEPVSAVEALQRIGADWEEFTAPAFIELPWGERRETGARFVVRTRRDPDGSAVVDHIAAAVTDRYTVLELGDFARLWDSIVQRPVHVAYRARGGRIVTFGTELGLPPRAEMMGERLRALLLAVHDATGRGAIKVVVAFVRLYCLNVLPSTGAEPERHGGVAMRRRVFHVWPNVYDATQEALRHGVEMAESNLRSTAALYAKLQSVKVDVAMARRVLRRLYGDQTVAVEAKPATCEDAPTQAQALPERPLSRHQRRAPTSATRREAPPPATAQGGSTRRRKPRRPTLEVVFELWTGRGTRMDFSNGSGSAWSLLNAIVEFEDHVRPGRDPVSAAEAALHGYRARNKARALRLLTELTSPTSSRPRGEVPVRPRAELV